MCSITLSLTDRRMIGKIPSLLSLPFSHSSHAVLISTHRHLMGRSGLLFAAILLVSAIGSHAAVPDPWKLGPIAPSELSARLAAVDRESSPLPLSLRPATEFQKILVRIAAATPSAEWRSDVEKFAKATGEDSVSKALRELALCWEARVRMQEIDKALRQFYRQSVRFPDRLDEVKDAIPANAKTDPWGEAWVYKTAAPQGFSNLAKQRYQLGPTRYPQLSTIQEFIRSTPPVRNWKISARDVGGAKALEVRTSDGKAAVVQAGGKVADATLAYIGDGWALFADTDRLFAIAF